MTEGLLLGDKWSFPVPSSPGVSWPQSWLPDGAALLVQAGVRGSACCCIQGYQPEGLRGSWGGGDSCPVNPAADLS